MYNPNDARKLLALPNSNTAEKIVKCRIPKGIVYIEGLVAPQIIDKDVLGTYARGGGTQLYFLEEDLEKIQIIEIFENNIK